MADFVWPYDELPPTAVSVNDMALSASGGRSISGSAQIIVSDAGYWDIVLDKIRIRSNAQVLIWRNLESGLGGRRRTILVPAYSRKFAPVPPGGGSIVAQTTAPIAANAVAGNIAVTTGAPPEPGQDFSTGERLYRLKTVGAAISGDIYPVKFWPPAREAIADGAALEFDRPVCRCRLKSDNGMAIVLDLLIHATPSVQFCEDV